MYRRPGAGAEAVQLRTAASQARDATGIDLEAETVSLKASDEAGGRVSVVQMLTR